eukprot:scaffold390_cov149-Skeletonema_menzelii.AAC.10
MSPMKESTTTGPATVDSQEIQEEVRVLKEALSVMEQQKARSRVQKPATVTPKKSNDIEAIIGQISKDVNGIEATIGQLGTGSKSSGSIGFSKESSTLSSHSIFWDRLLTSQSSH